MKIFKTSTIATCLFTALCATSVHATHFRGAAVVPTVDATGMLTIDAKSFWRRSVSTSAGIFPHSGLNRISVSGVGSASLDLISQDISDVRRARVDEQYSIQLPGAGLYTMSWGSGSWVNGVPNGRGSYGTTSTIFWDGSSANTPIQFDLENIQQEVLRGSAYSDNLDAVGTGLSYDDSFLGVGMSSQAPGFSIDASGQISMSAATTNAIVDNASSPGADIGFSGEISASDGSDVEFVWLFDAVDLGSNLAPTITDVVIDALVGDTIDYTLLASDPNGDPLTTTFLNFLSAGGNPANATFDPSSLGFSWDSTGFGVGSYVATFATTDGSFSDQGTITINLAQSNGGGIGVSVPEPTTILVFASGIAFLAGFRRRKYK